MAYLQAVSRLQHCQYFHSTATSFEYILVRRMSMTNDPKIVIEQLNKKEQQAILEKFDCESITTSYK